MGLPRGYAVNRKNKAAPNLLYEMQKLEKIHYNKNCAEIISAGKGQKWQITSISIITLLFVT